MDSRLPRKVVFTGGEWISDVPEDHFDWTIEPVFEFASEVEALQTLELMAEDYRAILRHSQEAMRYIKAAIRASQRIPTPEERVKPQALINHTRLARQTVYDALAPERAGEAVTGG